MKEGQATSGANERERRRIGIVVPGFSADGDDWCIPALRNMVRELAAVHDVQLFTLRYPHRREPYLVDGAAVHPLGGGLAAGIARIGLIARARTRIAEVHRERPLQLLHAFWADEPGFLAVTAGRALRIPVVVSVMGGELARLPEIGYGGQLERVNRQLTAFALRRAEHVTVGSEFLRRLYLSRGLRRLPTLLPLGVDTAFFRPAPSSETRPAPGRPIDLISVASLVPVKDHATLLRAFARARTRPDAPDLRLHLVGGGPLHAPLEALARDLGITGQLTFHGELRHEELPARYRAAALLVQSSRHESQGLAVLEAASCGTPAVGTAVGILAELGDASRVVPPADPEALAHALLDVVRDPATLAQMGRRASQAIERGYTLAHTMRRLEELHLAVLSRR